MHTASDLVKSNVKSLKKNFYLLYKISAFKKKEMASHGYGLLKSLFTLYWKNFCSWKYKKKTGKRRTFPKEEDIVSLNFKHIRRNLYIESYRLQLLYETVLK